MCLGLPEEPTIQGTKMTRVAQHDLVGKKTVMESYVKNGVSIVPIKFSSVINDWIKSKFLPFVWLHRVSSRQ
jgi:hypothetical protein